MTGAQAAAVLERHGLDERDAASRAALFDSVFQAFQTFTHGGPVHAWWVPGRLEVFGKHTDYCGGHSLVGTIPRGFAVAARQREDGMVSLLDARRAEEFAVGIAPDDAVTGWRRYADVVVRRLARNFAGAAHGADIVFASDLPSASGMSSSSALMVGLAEALVTLAGIRDQPAWRDNIRSPLDAAGYYACIENGMRFGTLAGDSGVGTHGGSEDHLAILASTARHLSLFAFVPIEQVTTVRLPGAWTFVVAASGVAARKTGEAQEAYNRLSREASALLTLWNRHEPAQPSLRLAVRSGPDAPARLRRLARLECGAGAARDLDRRLTHFLREDERVHAAAEAFLRADAGGLSRLAEETQADAETLLQNQVPETATLARLARDEGAFAASSFGAGFGGSVWALVEKEQAAAFAGRWLAAFRAAFPSRRSACTFVAHTAPPLTQVL